MGDVRLGHDRTTTPTVAPTTEHLMRATVKIRPQATAGSRTTRLITVSTVGALFVKDTVRFTAALGGCPDTTLVPGNLLSADRYIYDFETAELGTSEVFTLTNAGTGASDILGLTAAAPFSPGE